jgi:flagellar protein FlaI
MPMLIDVDVSSMFLSKFLDPSKKQGKKQTPEEKPAPASIPSLDDSLDDSLESLLEPVSKPGTKPEENPTIKKKNLMDRIRALHDDKCAAVAGVECYSAGIHGPLVDLTWDPVPDVEVIEVYPVNEPYAYVRVTYNNATMEYTYEILEPVLTAEEKELMEEVKQGVLDRLDINMSDVTKEKARNALVKYIDEVLADYHIPLSACQRAKMMYHIEKEYLGDGVIDAVMHDPNVEDISCDGVNSPIFLFHRKYESLQTSLMYTSAVDLNSFVTKLAQRSGKFISIAEPMLDATMTDGSRIQMTLGEEVTAHGSTFTIRKFKDDPVTPTDLIQWSTFSPLSIAYLWLAVENGKSCIFSGGTASGKTTSLNAIALFIPRMSKIITLEDTRELKLPHPNWIPSITRDAFSSDGKGSVDMYELLKAALRQRPEYLIVGEVRGKEALTLFQAMSTGHITYSTMHADSISSAVHRLENPPIDVPRNMLTALHIMCIQVQVQIGGRRTRRNRQIIEILDIDPRTNELITNVVFQWHEATDEIKYTGKSFVLESIMEKKGWDEARMMEELRNRQLVLQWMHLKKLHNYKEVSNVLISYIRRPEQLLEKVKAELEAAEKAAASPAAAVAAQ